MLCSSRHFKRKALSHHSCTCPHTHRLVYFLLGLEVITKGVAAKRLDAASHRDVLRFVWARALELDMPEYVCVRHTNCRFPWASTNAP